MSQELTSLRYCIEGSLAMADSANLIADSYSCKMLETLFYRFGSAAKLSYSGRVFISIYQKIRAAFDESGCKKLYHRLLKASVTGRWLLLVSSLIISAILFIVFIDRTGAVISICFSLIVGALSAAIFMFNGALPRRVKAIISDSAIARLLRIKV